MWPWAVFIAFIVFLLALDLGVFHRQAHAITLKEALIWSGVWIGVALAFSVFLYFSYEYHWFGLDLAEDEPDGGTAAVLFLTGYVVEKSLGVDNIVLIAMIFSYFRIPAMYQHRVLFWGVAGALVMRGAMILVGVALIERFHWILYVFGGFLIVIGIRMALARNAPDPANNPVIALVKRLLPVTHNLAGERLVIRISGKLTLTPLALALIMIETSDLIFAVTQSLRSLASLRIHSLCSPATSWQYWVFVRCTSRRRASSIGSTISGSRSPCSLRSSASSCC